MKLADFLVREAIITDLLARTKEEAIREIVRSVQSAGYIAGVDAEVLVKSFMKREELGSTAVGKGVACPHGGHEAVDHVFGTVALSRPGVAFGAVDGKPVHIIVLLFHTPDQFMGGKIKPNDPRDIYTAFDRIRKHLQDDDFLARLRECQTREDAFQLIVDCDRDNS
jgi:PTS system fructose-specific IIA component/PTS system nitrogen regulatory IIA component